MKKIRIITGVLTAAVIAASFAGCGGKTETQDVSSMSQEQKAPTFQRGTMAKVVSLDGDQLTVVLAKIPNGGEDGQMPPEGAAPPENSTQTDGGNPSPPQSGGSGPASGPAIDGSDQTGQPGQGGGKIQFTGEEVAYTLSGDVSVKKGAADKAAEIDLSELQADDVIRFTTVTDDSGNEVIDTILVME